MKKIYFLILVSANVLSNGLLAQDCQSQVVLKLNNNKTGGVFVHQTVELTNIVDKKVYTQLSDAKGEVTFTLPCDQRFDVQISNYPSKDQIKSPATQNSRSSRQYSYGPDMIKMEKEFAMTEMEKQELNRNIMTLPDTTKIFNSVMVMPKIAEHYATMAITLIGLDNNFLVDEEIIFTGTERKKSFKGKTNSKGTLKLYLPKGDVYTINFKYHNGYSIHEIKYSQGTSNARIEIMYMGTIEYLRRKKAEELRVIEEQKQVAAALLQAENEFTADEIVSKVLDRNHWVDKLFISDVSYEMLPYASKLASWYKANEEKEKSTQFVFFYNGVNRTNGKSSSAFHQTAQGYDNLIKLINMVHTNVGLEKATNDIEGLIKSMGISNPYKEIVMLVDKDASLRDFNYFIQLEKPVHIILCVQQRTVNPQHLKIAWKTKGSFHTLTEDITTIGNLIEGDTITVEGIKYKILGGEFVRI